MKIRLHGQRWLRGWRPRGFGGLPGAPPAGLLPLLAAGLLLATTAGCSGLGSGQATGAGARGDTSTQTQRVPVDGGGSYTDVGASGLSSMLKGKDFPLINVHVPYEGEIEGTDAFIPYNEIEAKASLLPRDRASKVVLYCRSGSMSAIAARAMVKMGYTDVWNLDGGMIGWKEAGYPVLDKKR